MTTDPGRISHVLYCFRPENIDAAADFWRTTFGVVFDEVEVPGSGLRILFSYQSGIELIAPVDPTGRPQYWQFLEERGEGLHSIVYKVDDVDKAAARAAEGGVATRARISYTGRDPWAQEYEVLEEAILEEHCSMRVVIGQIERRPDAD